MGKELESVRGAEALAKLWYWSRSERKRETANNARKELYVHNLNLNCIAQKIGSRCSCKNTIENVRHVFRDVPIPPHTHTSHVCTHSE